MSWLFSQELVLQYNCRYDNVLTKFASMEVTCENLSTLSDRIQAEKERARVLLPVLCKRQEGAKPIWSEYWTEEELGISGENRQGWICTLLRCIASILKRQKDDAEAHNGDGVADWATNTIRRGCTPQEWEQAGQQARELGINDAIRTFQNAWPDYEEREEPGWTVCVNLPSLRALVAAYSAENSLDGEQFVLSNTNPTPQAFLPQDKMTAFSTRSLSGMTFGLLMDDPGEILLMWFRGAFPAKTYQWLEKVQVLEGPSLECGQKCSESFARYNPESHTLKTHQHLLFEDSTECCAILPRWGSMQDGELFLLPIPALPIYGKGSGSLPTPTATDYKGGRTPEAAAKVGRGPANGFRDFCRQVLGWIRPYPEASENLMGWPDGWTDLAPLATDKFQQWQQQHLGF